MEITFFNPLIKPFLDVYNPLIKKNNNEFW